MLRAPASRLGLGLGRVTARWLNAILRDFPGLPAIFDFFVWSPEAAWQVARTAAHRIDGGRRLARMARVPCRCRAGTSGGSHRMSTTGIGAPKVVLEASDVHRHYRTGVTDVHALRGVSLDRSRGRVRGHRRRRAVAARSRCCICSAPSMRQTAAACSLMDRTSGASDSDATRLPPASRRASSSSASI